MTPPHRTAILLSGGGTNLQALIDAAQKDKAFPAALALVISNKADAYGLKRAKDAGIAAMVIPHKDYTDRETFDAAIHDALEHHKISFVCLAGFMRILSETFVSKWAGRMLNIHPSLLPAFRGNRTHEQVLSSSATFSGCTVHAVTSELDDGPIVAQAVVKRDASDTIDCLASRVQQAEHLLYPLAVRAFLRPTETTLPQVSALPEGLINFNAKTRYRPQAK